MKTADINNVLCLWFVLFFFYIYAEKECARDTFGADCSQKCSSGCIQPNIPDKRLCDHINGTCLYGCRRAGYTGARCTEKCSNVYFGVGCQELCSRDCRPPSQADGYLCDYVNGVCLNGCNPGFTGSLCTDICPKGTYGEDCKDSCSSNCAPAKDSEKSSCYHVDGSCRSGCISGFSGISCSQNSQLRQYTGIILALCIAVSLICFTTFSLLRKMKTNPKVPEDISPDPAGPETPSNIQATETTITAGNQNSFKFDKKRRASKSKEYADKRHQSVSV